MKTDFKRCWGFVCFCKLIPTLSGRVIGGPMPDKSSRIINNPLGITGLWFVLIAFTLACLHVLYPFLAGNQSHTAVVLVNHAHRGVSSIFNIPANNNKIKLYTQTQYSVKSSCNTRCTKKNNSAYLPKKKTLWLKGYMWINLKHKHSLNFSRFLFRFDKKCAA